MKNDKVSKSVRRKPDGSGGSRKGIPNKVTADGRAAIALFVDGNAHRLTGWLDQVASGYGDTNPNPAKAFELFQSVVEYHIPKLARTESTMNMNIKKSASEMTDEELAEVASKPAVVTKQG